MGIEKGESERKEEKERDREKGERKGEIGLKMEREKAGSGVEIIRASSSQSFTQLAF